MTTSDKATKTVTKQFTGRIFQGPNKKKLARSRRILTERMCDGYRDKAEIAINAVMARGPILVKA